MTIRLTPKQYKTLIKMSWLASRVAQGAELQESDTVTQIGELTDFLCSQAPQFDAEDLFEDLPPEPASQEFRGAKAVRSVTLKPELEDELNSIIEWFEEFSFWDVLEDRLAMRDISEERTEAQWNWLPDAEKDRIYDKYLSYYFEEFSEMGISNLRLVEPEPGKPRIPIGWGEGAAPAERGAPPPEAAPNGEAKAPEAKIIEFPGKGPSGKGPGGKPPKKPRS